MILQEYDWWHETARGEKILAFESEPFENIGTETFDILRNLDRNL